MGKIINSIRTNIIHKTIPKHSIAKRQLLKLARKLNRIDPPAPRHEHSWIENHISGFTDVSPMPQEAVFIHTLRALEFYLQWHLGNFGNHIGNDYVMVEGVRSILEGLETFLNGELGRLDAGTVSNLIWELRREHKIGPED